MNIERKHAALGILSKYPHTVEGLHAAIASDEWQAHPLLTGATIEDDVFHRILFADGVAVEVGVSSDAGPTAVWPMGRGLDEPPDILA